MGDPGNGVPPRTAEELVELLEHRLGTGELAPGDRLEPVRAAADRFGLAPNTVAAAYRRLRDRGLVRGEGRRGTFVTDRAAGGRPARHRPIPAPLGHGIVDLASGNPDPSLLPALGPALAAVDPSHVLYGRAPTDPGLAAALTTDLGHGLGPLVPEDERFDDDHPPVLVGGALDGIERVLQAHLRPGDRVVVEDPGYAAVLDLVAALGLRVVPVPIDDRGPRPQALDAALATGGDAVILTPRAQNPTGAAIDGDRAEALAAVLASRPEVLVIEDDHAGPVAGVPHHRVVDPTRPRWAIVRSLAKSLGPDLRLAALTGDPTTLDRVLDRRLLGPGWVPHLVQRLAAALLTDPAIGSQLRVAADTYRTRRELAIGRLAAAGVGATGRSGLNVWVPVADEAAVVAGLQQRGWAVRSGSGFRQRSGPAVRLSVASAAPDVIDAAVDALVEVLDPAVPAGRWV